MRLLCGRGIALRDRPVYRPADRRCGIRFRTPTSERPEVRPDPHRGPRSSPPSAVALLDPRTLAIRSRSILGRELRARPRNHPDRAPVLLSWPQLLVSPADEYADEADPDRPPPGLRRSLRAARAGCVGPASDQSRRHAEGGGDVRGGAPPVVRGSRRGGALGGGELSRRAARCARRRDGDGAPGGGCAGAPAGPARGRAERERADRPRRGGGGPRDALRPRGAGRRAAPGVGEPPRGLRPAGHRPGGWRHARAGACVGRLGGRAGAVGGGGAGAGHQTPARRSASRGKPGGSSRSGGLPASGSWWTGTASQAAVG